jgi:hypothetical protein
MRTYQLKTKSGETIKKIDAESLEQAIDFFSDIKQLTKKQLLKLFIVTE